MRDDLTSVSQESDMLCIARCGPNHHNVSKDIVLFFRTLTNFWKSFLKSIHFSIRSSILQV